MESKAGFALRTSNLNKRFGSVQANRDISFGVLRGSCHGIVGENGAGKSTLLKMLFGFYQPDRGDIYVNGEVQDFNSPADALSAGIGMVHQHFMLVDTFTVLENIVLGAETSGLMTRSMEDARPALLALEDQFGFDVPLDAKVGTLPVGTKQRVEILKALYRGADILILDEPTAVLTPQETTQFFALLETLKAQDKTLIFVTHKLNEIMAITDRVTVVRGGLVIDTVETSRTSPGALAKAMVGTEIGRAVTAEDTDLAASDVALSVRAVAVNSDTDRPGPDGVSFDVHSGEILGIAGVAGNGQSELIEALMGTRSLAAGEIWAHGRQIAKTSSGLSPARRRDLMGMVAEDRLKDGVVETMSGVENAILGYHRRAEFEHRAGIQNRAAIAAVADRYYEQQDIRPRIPSLPIGQLSGGNQQKLVMVREFAHNPKIMVIGQPTRGVDIGAVTRIHDQLTALRNAGTAILVVSADLDELMAISDRIAVMSEGRIVGIVDRHSASQEDIGLMMAGLDRPAATATAAVTETATLYGDNSDPANSGGQNHVG